MNESGYSFSKVSGLKIKTKAIWFGAKSKYKMRLCNDWDLDWSESDYKVLGIMFDAEIRKFQTLISLVIKSILGGSTDT